MSMRPRVAAVGIIVAFASCADSRPKVTVPAPAVAAKPDPAVPAPPATVPAVEATKVRALEGITEYALPNGLQILLIPDATQSNVTVNVTYRVGSRHEGYGETGMAHLLEHMMFKGTKKLREISKILDEKGAANNASTDYDRTNYYETFPATVENVDFMLAMEADRMVNSTFLEDDLASEFSVVRNEFEIGENDPGSILWERVRSTAFLWHNYGKSVIGSRADIEKVPASALRVFYATYYQPDNATLIVAGKFDQAHALATIEREFGALAKPTRVLPPAYTVEPVQDGEREVTLRRAGDVTIVGMAWHAVAGTSPDYPAVEAAMDILGREPSGRLYKAIVEPKLAASVSAGSTANHDPQLVEVYATMKDGRTAARVEQIIAREVESLASRPIDPKDLERWRASRTKEIELAMTSSEDFALELSEAIALGDWRMFFAYRDAIANVTAADVQRVAKLYFVQSNRTVGRFVPTAPKAAEPRAPFTEAPAIGPIVEAVKGRPEPEPGESFVASPDTIEARTQRRQLANGMSAALLAKKTRGHTVLLRLVFRFGDERSLQNTAIVAQLAGSLLWRGTTKHTYQQLADLEDQLKARIAVGAGANYLSIDIETLRDHLPAALDLAAEIAMSPSFPAKELELVRHEKLTALAAAQNDPEALSAIALAQITNPWPKGDPRAVGSLQDQIAGVHEVTLADIKAFYAGFVGGGHGDLVVVGDFEPDAIAAQVDRLFGAWKAKVPYVRMPDKAFGVAGTTKVIDTKDKENAVLAIAHDVALRDDDPDYPAWIVLGQILGGDQGSRIWQRLREKGGLSYGAGGSTSASAWDPAGEISAYAQVAPANLGKAKAALLDELGRLATAPFTAAEVDYAKHAFLEFDESSWSSDSSVASTLLAGLETKRTYAYVTALRAKIAAVSPADVERVAKKYVKPDRFVIVEAGDHAKVQ